MINTGKTSTKKAHSTEKIGNAELSTLATQINSYEAQICGIMGQTLHFAALIGADLNFVKERLPNNSFMEWVEKNCCFKQHQCNRYMRLAKKNPEYLDPEKCPVNLSINAALELISAPDDVVELVHEAIADGEIVHQRTVRELCGKSSYPDGRLTAKPTVVQLKPIDAAPRPEYFRLTDHCCVTCMGRLLIRRLSGRNTKFETICAICEDRNIITDEADMPCWCNKTLGDPKNGGYDENVRATRKSPDKIFECIQNPDRSVVGNRIIVREKPHNPVTAQKQVRSVFSGDRMDYL